MSSGILMCFGGALSFGLLACVSKMAERKKCNASALVVWLFAWASAMMVGRSLTLTGKVHLTWPIIAIAVGFGICAAIAYLAFQISIASGRVTVGWLMMNLSSAVPALVSIWIYAENLTVMKSIALSLALFSFLCLFQGNRLEAQSAARQRSE